MYKTARCAVQIQSLYENILHLQLNSWNRDAIFYNSSFPLSLRKEGNRPHKFNHNYHLPYTYTKIE